MAIYHQNNFATNLTSNILAGATTAPLNSIPSVAVDFYLALDATNINNKYEVVLCTSKNATNVNFAACTYAHTTAEEVRMVVPADELDALETAKNNLNTNFGTDGYTSSLARQAVMNGNFDVWQRGTSLALADVTIQFLADRWADYVDKNGGTLPTLTRSRQLHTSGDIANSFYFTRLATDGAGTSLGANSRGTFIQRIENGVRNLCGAGKKVTVSFWARSSITNKRICPTIELNYGTGGSPTVTEFVNGTPITLTSTWTQYTATFTTNTLVGKTFGTANNDYIQLDIHYMWGTTFGNTYVQTGVSAETYVGSGNIDIAQVQLCAGEVALPFQPKSYEEELRACRRYYEIAVMYGVAVDTNIIIAGTNYATTKRVAPSCILNSTVVGTGTDNYINRHGVGNIAISSPSFSGSVYGIGYITKSGAFVLNNWYGGSVKASAEL